MADSNVWLAKHFEGDSGAMTTSLENNLANRSYSCTVSIFDPRGISIEEARRLGRETSVWGETWGKRFGSQIWHMANTVKVGDLIFIESENKNIHAFGKVTGPYRYNEEAAKKRRFDRVGAHEIPVDWIVYPNGREAVKISRGDNLVFRQVSPENRLELRNRLLEIAQQAPTQGPASAPSEKTPPPTPRPVTPEEPSFEEGGRVLVAHEAIERDPAAARLAKQLARGPEGHNPLTCEICGTIPEMRYELDLIEAHHRVPLSLGGVRQTRPEDFAMLCPTCHRAVHKVLAVGKSDGLEAIQDVRRRLGR